MSQILIIDDDSILRGILRELLETTGYVVTEAEDGAQGIELLRAGEGTETIITMRSSDFSRMPAGRSEPAGND
jgi:CheY-like chemotaxis protein